ENGAREWYDFARGRGTGGGRGHRRGRRGAGGGRGPPARGRGVAGARGGAAGRHVVDDTVRPPPPAPPPAPVRAAGVPDPSWLRPLGTAGRRPLLPARVRR